MKSRTVLGPIFTVLVLFLLANPTWGQDPESDAQRQGSRNRQGMIRLGDRGVLLPITAVEWGVPDRWSFSSLLIYRMGDVDAEAESRKTWHHNLHASLSPGLSGGRIGMGYGFVYDPREWRDFGILGSCRAVLLRSWGSPLFCSADRTYAGAEIKVSISFLLSVSVGYYSQISDSGDDEKEQFWGFHCGVGI